jgi:hypothetical protein
MTKEQWVSLLVDYMAGGDCPADLRGRYHPIDVADYFSLLYSSVIFQVHGNAVRYRDYAQFDSYVKAYNNVTVQYDTDRNEYYCLMPAEIISLPENRGIRSISPMKDQSTKFWYSDNNTADIYKELEVNKIINKVSYYVEGNKVYFRNFDTNYINDGLLFKIIVSLNAIADTDEIGLPAQMSGEIFVMLTNLLKSRPAEKQTNDNTSIQTGGQQIRRVQILLQWLVLIMFWLHSGQGVNSMTGIMRCLHSLLLTVLQGSICFMLIYQALKP